jgi:hypothetical protein
MASLAGLSSHRRPCTRCGHIALPIVQIGASPKGVACRASPRSAAQSGNHCTWPVDDFHRIAQGHRRDASCRAFANCTLSRAQSQADHNSFMAALCVCHERSETLQKFAPKSKDLQKPVTPWRSPCDSATADKVMRNDTRPGSGAKESHCEQTRDHRDYIRGWRCRGVFDELEAAPMVGLECNRQHADRPLPSGSNRHLRRRRPRHRNPARTYRLISCGPWISSSRRSPHQACPVVPDWSSRSGALQWEPLANTIDVAGLYLIGKDVGPSRMTRSF